MGSTSLRGFSSSIDLARKVRVVTDISHIKLWASKERPILDDDTTAISQIKLISLNIGSSEYREL